MHPLMPPYAYTAQNQDPRVGPPNVLGVPTRTEIYRVRDVTTSGPQAGPGLEIQFLDNGVITGIKLGKLETGIPEPFNCAIDILKDGEHHLCTNGDIVQVLSLADLGQPLIAPWTRTWIPIRRGERWRVVPTVIGEEVQISWGCSLRVEHFLEDPAIERLESMSTTETVFYKTITILPEDGGGPGQELDFSAPGILTGLLATSDLRLNGEFNIDLDILQHGQIHLTNNGKAATRVSINELSPWADPWFPMWVPINRHEKWQVFAWNHSGSAQELHVIARVEQERRPWLRDTA